MDNYKLDRDVKFHIDCKAGNFEVIIRKSHDVEIKSLNTRTGKYEMAWRLRWRMNDWPVKFMLHGKAAYSMGIHNSYLTDQYKPIAEACKEHFMRAVCAKILEE